MAESRMNLAALQQRDPFISEIIDTVSHVALYSFNSTSNEWEKTSIEGTLFVYKRSAAPLYGFMILNRLGLQNLIEPFTKTLEFQVQEPFLLYRNAKTIYGIWFYEKNDCTRLGALMNKTAQSLHHTGTTPETTSITHIRMNQQQIQQVQPSKTTAPVKENSASLTVDIMKILTKAQHEYDQSKSTVVKGSEPKSMTDNLSSAIYTREQPLIRPTPVKFESPTSNTGGNSPDPPPQQSGDNPMSIEDLFRKASINQHRAELPDVTKPSALQRSISQPDGDTKQDLHPLLMQLINKTPTVDQIEQNQKLLGERNPSQGQEESRVSPRSDTNLANPLLKSSEVMSQPAPPYVPAIPSSELEKDVTSSISCPDVLLSPMAFTKNTGSNNSRSHPSSSASLNVTGSDNCLSESSELEESSLPVAALTKQQLQQAFSYLLKNDENFMSKLHEAYLKSLQELTKKS